MSCVLRSEGDEWRDQGIQVGPAATGAVPGLGSSVTTRLSDGEVITTASGIVPTGATRVMFRLHDGTQVDASIVGST